MNYPRVDRSDLKPNFDGRLGDDMIDVGWAEGELADGRPYRIECWALAGTTGVSIFMASEGIETFGPDNVNQLLERSKVITTLVPQELSIHRFSDPAGTDCLSISYVVADEDDEHFVLAHPALNRYARNGT